MKSVARKIHGKAEKAREGGKFVESLKFLDEALVLYQSEENYLGMADTYASRTLTLRHFYQKTGDKVFMGLAKQAAATGVALARNHGGKDAIIRPLFNLAKTQKELGQIDEAVESYREALELMKTNPSKLHDSPAVLADMKNQLAVCEYLSGDESAMERAEETLADLEKAEEERYTKDVWMSGAHMRIAEALKEDDPKKAKRHLKAARKIIWGNKELKLRKGQWKKLNESLAF